MFNSDRLKRLRKQQGLTQLQMSERLHIQQSSYSKYETNKADLNLSLLQKIQEEFGVDPKEFIVITDKSIRLENNSTVQGKGAVNMEDHYAVPKEIMDCILSSQQNILQLINMVIQQK
jgi:transcriptional regulator with XRE-family HTH domain